ncbi:MAG TPA: hypothetical protein ENI34_09455 [candidate division WOR-3 bacterium]|uniref:Tetratricopeptide repeat protein n=1 Tax=candidate division WOR-3 bacterium TaxID=2052148 RepID=A0A9C9ENH9_UNCW3|nr:hypothetical protein [candidate division WOR-3 bacterium]
MLNRGKPAETNKILMRVSELESKGKIKQAIKELQKCVKSNIKDGTLYNRLGDFYIKENDVKSAINTYKQGVEAFREDTFFRNALALCKKILRYDPGNIEIYWDIAGLLLDLDEKSDALIYYFAYIDKQLAQRNEEAVLKAIDKIKEIGIFDGKVIKKINETYKTLGRNDLLKKFAKQILKEDVREDIILEEIKEETAKPPKPKKEAAKEKTVPRKKTVESVKEEKRLKDDVKQLDSLVRNVEAAIFQLRKTMRLDEVIVALENSLTALSDEQKEMLLLLQKSISHNLDALQKSIQTIYRGSEKNIEELKPLLSDLRKALTGLSKNQASLAQATNQRLEDLNSVLNSTAENTVEQIREVMLRYQKATEDMCRKLEETKGCSISLVEFSKEMKLAVLKMNDSLIRFIMTQEVKERKQAKYFLTLIIITAVICGLFIFSLFK